MIALKLLTFLTLVYFVAAGKDLDAALKIMACAQRAIKNGVPELDIPSHSPVHITRNFSWAGDIGVASASLNLHDFIWDGLPEWEVSGKQINDDSEPYAVFDFDLKWKWFNISGDINGNVTELLLVQKFVGSLGFEWTDTKWSGRINVTKPNQNLPEEVNEAKIKWTVKHLDTTVKGFGLFNHPMEAAFGTSIISFLNTGIGGNFVGDFVKMRLNTIWWSTGKIWKLVEWCEKNPPGYY